MGYIVDCTDDWSVETRQESVRITTDYGDGLEIENKDLPDVIGALLQAANIQLVVDKERHEFFLDMVENFLRAHGRR